MVERTMPMVKLSECDNLNTSNCLASVCDHGVGEKHMVFVKHLEVSTAIPRVTGCVRLPFDGEDGLSLHQDLHFTTTSVRLTGRMVCVIPLIVAQAKILLSATPKMVTVAPTMF